MGLNGLNLKLFTWEITLLFINLDPRCEYANWHKPFIIEFIMRILYGWDFIRGVFRIYFFPFKAILQMLRLVVHMSVYTYYNVDM